MKTVLFQVIRAMRPKHWIKNLLVFALPLSDGLLIGSNFRTDAVWRGILVFMCLNSMSSANYIINDIRDLDEDRKHHTKKYRPFASGDLTIKLGIFIAASLVIASIGLSLLVGDPRTWILLLIFGSLQFAYSLFFKYHSGYDLVVLASLYVFRAIIPATYEDVVLSQWFLVIFFAAALFLASGKRYAEYLHGGRIETRTVLASYSESQLMMWVGISLTLLISSYLNWIFIFSDEGRFSLLLISLIPMSIILIRLSFLTMSKNGEDPTKIIFRDKNNFFLGIIWLGLYLFGKGYL